MYRIRPAIQPYAWGSHTFLARLQGRPAPTEQPEAELWLGAHPSAPATLADGRRLDAAIAADPLAALGERSVQRFGPQLPYLLKVLAAEQPLSLQAHPDKATAQAAFAQRHPSYVDGNHKPELLVALTEFDALCGFRPPSEAADYLASLDIRPLQKVIEKLAAADLRGAVEALYAWSDREREDLVPWVADAERHAGGGVAATLALRYPYDIGVVVALLLNHVTLQPGEAIWMPAGNLHAYLRGAGVEIMAASDNVLRGGLTPKRVDVPELLRILTFEPLHDPIRRAVREADGVDTWPVPVDDFALRRVLVDQTVLIGPLTPARGGRAATPAGCISIGGGRTTLCVSGNVTVADSEGSVELNPGEAAFGNADAGRLELTGAGVVFVASTQ
jgi:mannose-6-phosphate isomerase